MNYYKFSHQEEATISMRLLVKLIRLGNEYKYSFQYHNRTSISEQLVNYLNDKDLL